MTETASELLDYITTTIVECFKPERIILFGSHARGEAEADSDFDLYIEMPSTLRLPERASLISAAFGLRPWSLDLIVYTPQEAARLRQMEGSFLRQIESEGQVLYERR
jgi:predicted nucleotidyltransferase